MGKGRRLVLLTDGRELDEVIVTRENLHCLGEYGLDCIGNVGRQIARPPLNLVAIRLNHIAVE